MRKRTRSELFVSVDADSPEPLYQQLYRQIGGAVTSGALAAGAKLPSIRGLAKDLGVSHITVEKVYLQLVAEGYVEGMPRSGYIVREVDVDYFKHGSPDNAAEIASAARERAGLPFIREDRAGRAARYDFSYYNLQPGSFPRKAWARAVNEAMLRMGDDELVSYPDEAEPSRLQAELAAYLARRRGVACLPEQLIVTPGTEAALDVLSRLFDRGGDTVGIEEPGYNTAIDVFSRNGFRITPVTVDHDDPHRYLESLERARPRLVFATPSHQFPTGFTMPLSMRVELLKWAEANDAYIIEDDSCNEYRYSTSAIPSLQSLDSGNRIVYLCNFSKILSPGMRVAYLVLPPALLRRLVRTSGSSFTNVPALTQEALAEFIANGSMDAHARRMTTGNRARHDRLLECLQARMGDKVALSGVDSGMHFFATVRNGMTQEELIATARANGASVYGTRSYWFENDPPDNSLMIGFSAIALEDIEPGVAALAKAWL